MNEGNGKWKKNVYSMIICMILLITSISGCISDEKEYNPDLSISNMSSHDINVSVIVIKNDNEIINDTIFLKFDSKTKITQIKVPGTYNFNIDSDNNQSLSKEEKFSDNVRGVVISIYDDKITLALKVT
jgi:hypothetical protein